MNTDEAVTADDGQAQRQETAFRKEEKRYQLHKDPIFRTK